MSDTRSAADRQTSRRGFIVGGAAAAGLAVLHPSAGFGLDTLPTIGTWPWPTDGLDPVATAGAVTTGLSGCATTTFGLIVRKLVEVMGTESPWAMVPPQLASAFNGGGPYGSDCGSLQGGLLVMSLVGAPATLRQEYFKWYCEFPFPSTEWDHLYTFANTVQTVSGSPLCHESRSIWEGTFLRDVYPVTQAYDTSRCSKLPRDCTKKTVQLVNEWKLLNYAGVWEADPTFASCWECHTQLYAAKEPGGIHSGKEDCTNCHTVPRKHPVRGSGPR